MIWQTEVAGDSYQINTDIGHSIAIDLDFDAQQPNHFGAQLAIAETMRAGSFVGDTNLGGSCNVKTLQINPHCNGTHTETIAHICDLHHPMSLTIESIELPTLVPCVLITIEPDLAIDTNDDYAPSFNNHDRIISRGKLEAALQGYSMQQLQSVVIRTTPNDLDKRFQAYSNDNQPPFLSADAMRLLNEKGVQHLVMDVPSVDRLSDDGLMTCHHIFWQVEGGSHTPTINSLNRKTITEMAFISADINDGFYFISIAIPAIKNDASMSRPVLYGATKIIEKKN